MTKHVFLIDVTRHKGPVQSLIETARAHAGDFEASQLHWFRLADQAVVTVGEERELELNALATGDDIKAVIERVAASGAGEAQFHVFSYDGSTLRDVAASKPVGLRIQTQRYSQLRFSARKVASQAAPKILRSQDPLPLDEALDLAKQVLRENGHLSPSSAIRQSRLRGLMSRVDTRAQKNPSVLSSKTLISQILNVGLREGWLGQDSSGGSGKESIWFVEPAALEALADTRNPAALLAEAKTDGIVSSLKGRKLFAPKEIRDIFFESLLKINSGLSVTKMFREASSTAQQSAFEAGVTFEHWRPATESITNLAIKAGVLLDASGRAVPEGFASRGAIVSKVDPSIIDLCDACLLQETVRYNPGLIPNQDAPAIAHALFKKAPGRITQDEMIDRVHDVLAMLRGKLDQDAHGVLTVI